MTGCNSNSAFWHFRFPKQLCYGFIIQSRINQRSLDVAMPKQGLQGKDGHACIEQQRCAGVAELMRRDVDLRLFSKSLQAGLAVPIAQGLVVAGEEIFACILLFSEIGLNGFHCWQTEIHHTLMQVLGFSDTNGMLGQINITNSQVADFTGAESAMEHKQEPGAIHVALNGIEERLDLFNWQVPRQVLTSFQRADFQHAFADGLPCALDITQE